MNAVVIDQESRSIALATTPADLLRMAVEKGADLDRLEKLMDLQDRWEKDQARKAYVAAMAQFKSEPMVIGKDKHVSFATQKGKTEYDHATIGNVTAVICAGLAKHGLSHRWDVDQQDGGRIVVTCILTHELGHSERTTLKAGADDSGGKNSIQAIASTVTYLQRYTLLAATGMATSDQADDDGRQPQAPIEYISEQQAITLTDFLLPDEAPAFLAYMRVERMSDIYASEYAQALQLCQRKAKAREKDPA